MPMLMTGEPLIFSAQGGEYSYCAEAARRAAMGGPVVIHNEERFNRVIEAVGRGVTEVGIFALYTVSGTVVDAAAQLVRKRQSELSEIVAKVDLPVPLALISSRPQSLEDMNRQGVRCYAQSAAWLQCEDFMSEHLPNVSYKPSGESTKAIEFITKRDNPNFLAIGPTYAAEPMGGYIVGPDQINPPNSTTSFFIIQNEIKLNLLPDDPEKTVPHGVVLLIHPHGEGEFERTMEIADDIGMDISRFIKYDINDFTKYNHDVKRGGGILEVAHSIRTKEVYEFCHRVNALKFGDSDARGPHQGPFGTIRLGGYDWYPEASAA